MKLALLVIAACAIIGVSYAESYNEEALAQALEDELKGVVQEHDHMKHMRHMKHMKHMKHMTHKMHGVAKAISKMSTEQQAMVQGVLNSLLSLLMME